MAARILLSTSNDWLSNLIRGAIFSRYSHAELLLEDGTTFGADFPGGVAPYNARRRIAESTEFAILEHRGADEREVLDILETQRGKPYDKGAALGVLFRRNWQNPRKWDCSEFLAWGFALRGHQLVRADAWRVTPQDLYESMALEVIQEGAGGADVSRLG